MQLHKDTLKFLKDLKKNNNKAWLDSHRVEYEVTRKVFIEFVDELLIELKKINPSIDVEKGRDCVFRINRDIRFAKDKSPYKNNYGAGFSKGGKKSPWPGFYFHIEPNGNNYIGGGLWQPEKEVLQKVRQEIDYNFSDFKKIINKPSFKKTFPILIDDDKLKTAPKGYGITNPAIEYLKFKNFVTGVSFKDTEVLDKNFIKKVLIVYKELNPLINFLSQAFHN
jgi:uncharacterized protein (TIGR02453 family)